MGGIYHLARMFNWDDNENPSGVGSDMLLKLT